MTLALSRKIVHEGHVLPCPYPTGLLLSYWYTSKFKPGFWVRYVKHLDALGLHRPTLLIDSGVYSARIKGVEINVQRYAEWMSSQDWLGGLTAAVDVDFPPDPAIVKKHTLILRRALGADKVWPVVHPCYKERDVEEVFESCTWASVGVWGTGNVSGQAQEFMFNKEAHRYRMKWYEHTHRIARKYGTRLHALGIGMTTSVLEAFDWASSDASIIGSVDAWGMLIIWDKDRRELRTVMHAPNRPGGGRFHKQLFLQLAEQGVSLVRCIKEPYYRQGVAAYNLALMEQHYARRNTHGFRFFSSERSLSRVVRPYVIARRLMLRQEGLA